MSEAAEGDWMGVGGQESVRLLFYALLSRSNFIFASTCDFCASLPQAYLGAFGHGGGRLPGHVHCKANGCLCLQVHLSPPRPLSPASFPPKNVSIDTLTKGIGPGQPAGAGATRTRGKMGTPKQRVRKGAGAYGYG